MMNLIKWSLVISAIITVTIGIVFIKNSLTSEEKAEYAQLDRKIKDACSRICINKGYMVRVGFIPYEISYFSNIAPEAFDKACWIKKELSLPKDEEKLRKLCEHITQVRVIGNKSRQGLDIRWSISVFGNKKESITLYGDGKSRGEINGFYVKWPHELDNFVESLFSAKDLENIRKSQLKK